jgi:sugar phosphate isomerase/epimerase
MMKLGIIGDVAEKSFQAAAARKLDFLEFCINVKTDPAKVFSDLRAVKGWMKKHKLGVQSIGRWGSDRLDQSGKPVAEELAACRRLIDAAGELGCPNFVCGCNYVKELSLFDNYRAAIEWLGGLIEYARPKGVRVSLYNCHWNNYLDEPNAWAVVLKSLPDLGLKYDPSHSRYAGRDYLKEMRDWGDRFRHVHIKGSLIIGGQRFDDPPAGMDQTDWGSFLAILYAKKYDGGLSLEPHSANWQGELGELGVDFTIAFMKRLLFRSE